MTKRRKTEARRQVQLFDTLSGVKELVSTFPKKPLRIFVCGPTVYDFSHIGHGRTYVVFDALVKYLRSTGLDVFYLQNITNIDDKIIRRAAEEKVDFRIISKKFTQTHLKDMKSLGVTAVDKYAPATDYIPEIVKQVKKLIEKKHAYVIEKDGIYFDVTTFKDYGKLSRRTTLQAEDGVSRIDESVNKRNKADFALWKYSKANEPKWETELGTGRPGWHIEDTAISEKYFGPQYDIHGGGLDNKFPHHEAEIAQQESASGKKPFVKIWLHTGFLTVNGEKMSKSTRNFITISDFLKNFSPEVFRLLALSNHYRSPLDYTTKLGNENRAKWLGILEFLAKLKLIMAKGGGNGIGKTQLGDFKREFDGSLADDFNTTKALGALFSLIAFVNPRIWKTSKSEAREFYSLVVSGIKMLGFKITFPKTPKTIQGLVRKREELRRNQQFTQSDRLRKKINDLGFGIEDTPLGPFIWPLR